MLEYVQEEDVDVDDGRENIDPLTNRGRWAAMFIIGN